MAVHHRGPYVPARTGDRHTGKYAPDGRLFISFRDTARVSGTQGDWAGWVGTWDEPLSFRLLRVLFAIAPNAYYRLWVVQERSCWIGFRDFLTGPAGTVVDIKPVDLRTSPPENSYVDSPAISFPICVHVPKLF